LKEKWKTYLYFDVHVLYIYILSSCIIYFNCLLIFQVVGSFVVADIYIFES